MLRVETHRSGVFTFQSGIDLDYIQPMLERVEDAHARFSSMPIIPDVATKLEKEVLVSSVFGTNTIEGGTLTEAETADVISGIRKIRDEKERRVDNIKKAYDKAGNFAEYCLNKNKDQSKNPFVALHLQEEMFIDLHAIITDGLSHPQNKPGQYRDNKKGQLTKVGDTEHGGIYTPPKCRDDITVLIINYLQWINSEEVINLSPLIRAPLAHYYFERIHPFWDGNGRVGRVIEMLILKCAGYKYAHYALSRYYLENIDEYFSVFNLARKAEIKKEKFPNMVFIELFLNGILDIINKLHDRVNRIIAFMLYQNLLNSFFQKKKINMRQYTIINNLLPHGLIHDLSKVQSQPWYIALYNELTTKTQSRDMKGLEVNNLIKISEDKKINLLVP